MSITTSPILAPVVSLVLWSLIMEAWLYAVRVPAMIRLRIKVDPANPHAFNEKLPASVRWKADNYNHLMEQPTIFYAVAITLAVAGAGHGVNASLAWLYVILRVIHSFIQVTVNHIMARFFVFVVSSFVLLALTIQALFVVF
eukprot:Phypoly_transcript_24158.p1 GENE.Phypoly_transcript_24158~~Phypoly_transcript_24158.p1  ORF type:complete len:142 (+),score=9.39 Phypoly_transcript_24158:119-544(+)